MLVKYVVKTTIIHFFKEFQDCKKRLFLLFVLLTSREYDTPSNTLFKENKILKISGFIKYLNTEFVRKCIQQENVSIFNEMFHTLNQNHSYSIRAANQIKSDQTIYSFT